MKNKKREFIFLSLLFFLLIIDNSILYISEFSSNFYLLYENSQLFYFFVDLIYLGIVLTARFIISERFDDKITIREKYVWIGIVVLLSIISLTSPYDFSEGIIYIALFSTLLYLSFKVYKHIKKYNMLIFSIIALNVFGIIESCIYYLPAFQNSILNLIGLEYRFISMDILKLLICILGIKYFARSFESVFNKTSIEDNLDHFCAEYALTARQKEILKLVIDGCSNKEIGDQLHITEGTVKTHIYNIFKKTDVSNRNQIINKIIRN